MKLCRIKGADIRCSPLLLLMLPAAYLLGRMGAAAMIFAALSVHEAAHALAARRAGCTVYSVELQPFGFVARLDTSSASPHDAAAVFAAGPVASLCLAACAQLTARYLPQSGAEALSSAKRALDAFCGQNLLIAAVNLLPAVPLDGGRLLFALICGADSARPKPGRRRLAARVLASSGAAVGVLFTAAFFLLLKRNSFNPTFLVMGVFLAIAAVKELRSGSLPVHRKKLSANGAVCIKQLAVGENVSIASALRMLPAGAYALVSVVDGSGRIKATLDEAQLLRSAEELGASARLGTAVAYMRSKVL